MEEDWKEYEELLSTPTTPKVEEENLLVEIKETPESIRPTREDYDEMQTVALLRAYPELKALPNRQALDNILFLDGTRYQSGIRAKITKYRATVKMAFSKVDLVFRINFRWFSGSYVITCVRYDGIKVSNEIQNRIECLLGQGGLIMIRKEIEQLLQKPAEVVQL